MEVEHEVIRLLRMRKKSHPEEFAYLGRWHEELTKLGWFMTEAERQEIFSEYRKHVFDTVQYDVMKKLITGDNHG